MTAYDIMHKWDIRFSGFRGEPVDCFIARVEDGRALVNIADADLLNCLPLFLGGLAYHWYKIERAHFTTWEACSEAMRRRFGDTEFQESLREEILERTQGPDEPVSDYLTCMRNLFSRLEPPYGEEEQLNLVLRRLLPRYQVGIRRADFHSMEGLEHLACAI